MLPATWDLVCKKGATFDRTCTFKADGVAVNLTGYTARMQVRDLESDELVATLTTENGRIILGGSAGTIRMLITAADTADLTTGRHKYDMELVSGGGYVYCPFMGAFEAIEEVTV
jgi:hypothetical protein